MNEENMKKFHPELAEYYQKGDCCTWIVELRKQVSEKDKEIERLNNIINQFEEWLNDLGAWCYVEKLKELKESGNNEG